MAEEVTLKILAETRDAIKNVETFGSNAKNALAAVEKSFGFLKGAAVAAIGILAGRQVINAVGEWIEAAAAQEQAVNDLNAALASTGTYSEAASKALVDFASGLQTTTKYEDDAIIKTEALIATLTGIDTSSLERATKAAADLASARGIDIETAANMIAKAINGSTESLKKFGVVVDKGADGVASLDEVLGQLEKRFGGRAEAEVKTFSGSIAQLKNAYGDLQEELGGIITGNDGVVSGIRGLSGVFVALTDIVASNKEAIQKFVKDGIEWVIEAIPTVISWAGKLATSLNTIWHALDIVKAAFAEIGSDIAISFIDNVVAPLQKGIKSIRLGFLSLKEVYYEADIALNEMGDSAAKALGFEKNVVSTTESSKKFLEQVRKSKKAIEEGYDDAPLVDFRASMQKAKDDSSALAKNIIKENEGIQGGFNSAATAAAEIGIKYRVTADQVIQNGQRINASAEENARKMQETTQKALEEELKSLEKLYAEADKAAKEAEQRAKESAAETSAYITNAISGGAAGIATSLVSTFADSIMPGIGGAAGKVFEFLTQENDKFKAQLESLLSADFIVNLTQNLMSIAKDFPAIAESFVAELVAALPTLQIEFAKLISSPKFYAEMTAGLARGLVDGITQAFKDLAKQVKDIFKFDFSIGSSPVANIGGEKKGALGFGGKFLGLAEGGIVPQGFPGDTFPARLTSGELVVPQDRTQDLFGMIEKISRRLDAPAASSQPSVIKLVVGDKELASVMYDLNRRGFRTA